MSVLSILKTGDLPYPLRSHLSSIQKKLGIYITSLPFSQNLSEKGIGLVTYGGAEYLIRTEGYVHLFRSAEDVAKEPVLNSRFSVDYFALTVEEQQEFLQVKDLINTMETLGGYYERGSGIAYTRKVQVAGHIAKIHEIFRWLPCSDETFGFSSEQEFKQIKQKVDMVLTPRVADKINSLLFTLSFIEV